MEIIINNMKNIHILPTDKPSRLKQNKITKKLSIVNKGIDLTAYIPIEIYITSDEEIKKGDWVIDDEQDVFQVLEINYTQGILRSDGFTYVIDICKKIILTTDQDLIGVQVINDKFLEWFVKNPSCEEVEVKPLLSNNGRALFGYKIIIPKEEPKQETLEDLVNKMKLIDNKVDLFAYSLGLKEGAKFQAERMYSEEEVLELLITFSDDRTFLKKDVAIKWFNQFKKK